VWSDRITSSACEEVVVSDSSDVFFYETARGHGLPHDPFKALVAPRPIGWISTIDGQGRVNLAPYSFFNAFSSSPPVVGFASEGSKDSVRNAEQTGEFVANLVSRSLAGAMNLTSAPVAADVDEFVLAGLVPAPCRLVRPPRVSESPAALECRVTQIVQLRDLAGRPLESYLTLGQVVGVHINTAYLKDGRFDIAAAQPVARAGYRGDYIEMGALFEMLRPGST
jgi:flavin reductase (DIM6/NTAB) family NADH-FMN oxidoreductase RutF